jgi:hypothetical protein
MLRRATFVCWSPCALAIAFALALALGCDPPAPIWTEQGPRMGGRFSAIDAPRDGTASPDRLLVASPGGGLFRTDDNGASWRELGTARIPRLRDGDVVDLQWDRDPASANRLFVATASGLYATTDAGASFSEVTRPDLAPPLYPLTHAEDAKPFAQLRFTSSGQRVILFGRRCDGLQWSYDGTTFHRHWPASPRGTFEAANLGDCIASIAADDATGFVYFSTMESSAPGAPRLAHIYRSSCAWPDTPPASLPAEDCAPGACPCWLTWTPFTTGIPTTLENILPTALVWLGSADQLMAEVMPSTGPQSVTFRTQPAPAGGGLVWAQTQGQQQPGTWDFSLRSLTYTGCNQVFLSAARPYVTNDGGTSWAFLDSGLPEHLDIRAFHTSDAFHFMWQVNDGSGTDAAAPVGNITRWTWDSCNTSPRAPVTFVPVTGAAGIPAMQAYFTRVVATSGGGRRTFLGTQDNGSMFTDDASRVTNWRLDGGCAQLDCVAMKIAPSAPGRAYMRSNEFVSRTDRVDAATFSPADWSFLNTGTEGNDLGIGLPLYWSNATMAIHPSDANRVYFVRSHSVGIGFDNGDGSMTITSSADMPGRVEAVSIYVDEAGVIYVGTVGAGAFRSGDNGVSWNPWALNALTPPIRAVTAITRTRGGVFYLATTRGLWHSSAGGFSDIGDGEPYSDVMVDDHCEYVYAATGAPQILASMPGQLRVSLNDGATWRELTSETGPGRFPITNLQLDPLTSRYVYVATYGRGVWRFDWNHLNASGCADF